MNKKLFEEYVATTGFGTPDEKVGPVFRVGVETITENRLGLKIIPTKYVVFRLGGEYFDLHPEWARDLADRIKEFADACERVTE